MSDTIPEVMDVAENLASFLGQSAGETLIEALWGVCCEVDQDVSLVRLFKTLKLFYDLDGSWLKLRWIIRQYSGGPTLSAVGKEWKYRIREMGAHSNEWEAEAFDLRTKTRKSRSRGMTLTGAAKWCEQTEHWHR